MSETVIKVDKLSKKYILQHQQAERYTALRDIIANSMKRLGSRLVSPFSPHESPPGDSQEDFFALRDVSFEIGQGEKIGIIGRNGAGKSTLLKILSRITEPSSGRIEITGRVASLLEVGTGFHPELTGRENIFLNGAILGMGRTEIRRKFAEIVEFAEVERFLDTPVKRYSSGMYVRLAFAVAAHLEPEILIVDEVLAVGDSQFQKKCLGKLESVGKEGRTVIFVSHNMSAIQALCNRCLVLSKGEIVADADVGDAVSSYLCDANAADTFNRMVTPGKKAMVVSGNISIDAESCELIIETVIFSDQARSVSLDVRLSDAAGAPVAFGSLGTLDPEKLIQLHEGTTRVSFVSPVEMLALGGYYISFDLTQPDAEYYDRLDNCFTFEIVRPPRGNARRVLSQSWCYGSIELPLRLV